VEGTDTDAMVRSGRMVLAGLKVAVILVAAFRVTVQVPVPLHPPPLHPVKREPEAALAVSVMRVPAL
jgi:hypothetical protein